MVEFEFGKLRSVYVYITKITSSYIYVTSTRNNEPYTPKGSIMGKHYKRTVSKIKIHKTVSDSYFKINMIREFSTPKLASINYYDGHIVSIETQGYNRHINGMQLSDNWQSNFSKVTKDLENHISTHSIKTYINGTEIFWFKKEHIDDSFHQMKLNKEGDLEIQAVEYVNIQTMGLSTLESLSKLAQTRSDATGESDALRATTFSQVLRINEGKVLAYYPNAPMKDIVSYSPVIKTKEINNSFKKQSKENKLEENLIYSIASHKTQDIFPNINFVLRSAKLIGELYGNKANEFLNIPDILASIGEVNFYALPEDTRASTPINISPLSCITWLMGFIYREKNIANLLDLSRMFRYVFSKGFTIHTPDDLLFKENKKADDIPEVGSNYFKKLTLNEQKDIAI